jgi:large subunit ribosomal protein L4
VIFGPRPRTIERRLNRRERREALRGALAEKARAQRVHLATSWGDAAKTKDRAAWLQRNGLQGRVLLVDQEPTVELQRSVANLRDATVARADSVGFYDVLVADHVVASQAAFDRLRGEGNGQ